MQQKKTKQYVHFQFVWYHLIGQKLGLGQINSYIVN